MQNNPSIQVPVKINSIKRHLHYCEGAISNLICNKNYLEANIAIELWLRFYSESLTLNKTKDFLGYSRYSIEIINSLKEKLKKDSLFKIESAPPFSLIGITFKGLRYIQNILSVIKF